MICLSSEIKVYRCKYLFASIKRLDPLNLKGKPKYSILTIWEIKNLIMLLENASAPSMVHMPLCLYTFY